MPRKEISIYERYGVTDEELLKRYYEGYATLGLAYILHAPESAIRRQIFFLLGCSKFERQPIPREQIKKIIARMRQLRKLTELYKEFPYPKHELEKITLDFVETKSTLITSMIIELYEMGYGATAISRKIKMPTSSIRQVLKDAKKIESKNIDNKPINNFFLVRGEIQYNRVNYTQG